MSLKAIKGKASKVGGFGAGYDYQNPTAPVQADPFEVGKLSRRGRGIKFGKKGHSLLSPTKGAGSSPLDHKGTKVKGGANITGGHL